MELHLKHDPTQKLGIYARAVKAGRKDIPTAIAMAEYMDANQEEWATKFDRKAWAIAHGQLENVEKPLCIFVVHPELVEVTDANPVNVRFPSRFIFNPELLEAPTEIVSYKPVRKTMPNPTTGRREIKMVDVEHKTPNTFHAHEGCMSFPLRKPKNVTRVFRVKVRYWYPVTWFGIQFLWRKTEYVEGLKAKIFQHEIQHFEGGNIYYEPEHTH